MKDLKTAKIRLFVGDCTCVLCKNEEMHVSTERGVKPLAKWLQSGADFSHFSAADKVVGKATAFLYVLLKVKAVYAQVISAPALQVFLEHGIYAEYGEEVPSIINRKGDGICPFEQCVLAVSDAQTAQWKIFAKLDEMGIFLS